MIQHICCYCSGVRCASPGVVNAATRFDALKVGYVFCVQGCKNFKDQFLSFKERRCSTACGPHGYRMHCARQSWS